MAGAKHKKSPLENDINMSTFTRAFRGRANAKKNKEDRASGKIDIEGNNRSKGNQGAKPIMTDY